MQFFLKRKDTIVRLILVATGTAVGYACVSFVLPFIIPTKTTDLRHNNLAFAPNGASLAYYYEPKPNSTETWNPSWLQKTVINHINADTLNETRDYSETKQPRTYRIVTLGDSFTYGHFVPPEANYTEKLEHLLNTRLQCPGLDHFDVINLGMPGYDIAYSVERLSKRGLHYDPDLVLWLINYWNMETINEERVPLQEGFAKRGIPVFNEKTGTNDAVIMALDSIKKKFGLDGILAYQKRQFERLPAVYSGDVLIFSFPGMPEKSKNTIQEFVRSHPKIRYWDGLFDYENLPQYHLYDHHPNESGHTRIASELFNRLAATSFARCLIVQ